MVDYKKKQEEGFSELKKILQEKGETETIQDCEVRMENVFTWYILVEVNWAMILCTTQRLNGNELEKYVFQLMKLVESYAED